MVMIIQQFAVILVLSLLTVGCIAVPPTDADLESNARKHPKKKTFELARNDNFIKPLQRESLVGRWKGSQIHWNAFWQGCNSIGTSWLRKIQYEYIFHSDGKYSVWDCSDEKHEHLIDGNWNYDSTNGNLTLEGFHAQKLCAWLQPQMQVWWINDKQMILTVRNEQTGRDYYGIKNLIDSEGKHPFRTIDWSRDRFGNIRTVKHLILNWKKSFRSEEVWTPEVCMRVDSEESGSSGKLNTFKQNITSTAFSAPITNAVSTMSLPSPLYKILLCERESGSNFAYRFELELTGKDISLRTFRSVQQEFRSAVRDDYAESFPIINKDSLVVDFPEYRLKGDKIEGRAVVLTISVTSLTYDSNKRAGKLAVKVNANQYEEARKWIRKNIETLARDKNIALTTGEIPPAAKFYLGREELKDGNVLEIEFKTE